MTDQFKTALARALASSAITAAMTFLTTWQTTDDPKTLTIAAGTAFLTPLALRWGGEGYLDTVRAERRKSEEIHATPAPRIQ